MGWSDVGRAADASVRWDCPPDPAEHNAASREGTKTPTRCGLSGPVRQAPTKVRTRINAAGSGELGKTLPGGKRQVDALGLQPFPVQDLDLAGQEDPG